MVKEGIEMKSKKMMLLGILILLLVIVALAIGFIHYFEDEEKSNVEEKKKTSTNKKEEEKKRINMISYLFKSQILQNLLTIKKYLILFIVRLFLEKHLIHLHAHLSMKIV